MSKQRVTLAVEVDGDIDPTKLVASLNNQARYARFEVTPAVPARHATLSEITLVSAEPVAAPADTVA